MEYKYINSRSLIILMTFVAFTFKPMTADSSPILPSQVTKCFSGSLVIDGGEAKSLAGLAVFTLQEQIDSKYDYLDHILWNIELKSYDGDLIANGFFSNDEATDIDQGFPQSIGSLGWGSSYWDYSICFSEYYAGPFWSSYAVGDCLMGLDWELKNNMNMLPTTFSGSGSYGYYEEGVGWMEEHNYLYSFEVQPVPEPTTMILFGSGLFFLVGFRKNIQR